MKTYKQIDFWVQVILISVFVAASLINRDYTFIAGYFTVGAWQVISMIVHQLKGCYTGKKMRRYYYHRIILFAVIAMCLVAIIPYFFMVYYVLLFVAPIMALYYLKICYHETFQYMVRPLDII